MEKWCFPILRYHERLKNFVKEYNNCVFGPKFVEDRIQEDFVSSPNA